MRLPAARISDMHVCPMVTGLVPHVGGPIVSGCPTVIIGGMPAARIGDFLVCVGPIDVVATGAETVLIGGMPAARITDTTVHGGKIVVGFPTVLIGGESTGKDDDSESNEEEEDGGQADSASKTGDEDAAGPDGQSADASGQDPGAAGGSGDRGGSGDGGGSGGGSGGTGAGGAGGDPDAVIKDGPIDTSAPTLKAGLEADVGTPPPDLGSQIGQAASGAAQGAWEGAVDAVNGIANLGRGAWQLATSAQARTDAYNSGRMLAGAVSQAAMNPQAAAAQARQAVTNAANNLWQARQAAYDAGKGAEFDGKLFGRAAFEAGSTVLPGAALHRLAAVSEAAKVATTASELSALEKNLQLGAKAAGVSDATSMRLYNLAAEENVVIKMRPTTPYAKDLLEQGTHLPKSADIKVKTLSPVDRQIGAPSNALNGEVVYFKPIKPDVMLAREDPAAWTAANNAYKARLDEYNALSKDMAKLQAENRIKLDNGVVKDFNTGKGFTGDNDIFDIHNVDGSPLSPEQMDRVMSKMQAKPIDAQHGGVMQWDTSKEAFDKIPMAERMKAQMIGAHTPYELGGAGKPLAVWGPGGYAPGFHIPTPP